MPIGATIAMLKRLGRVAGLQIDEASAELIARTAGNMPYWARKCASYLNRHFAVADRPLEIRRDRIAHLVDAFVLEEGAAIAEVALQHLFRVYPTLEVATARCHSGKGAEVSEKDRRTLRRYGIIWGDSDELSGKMISSAFASLANRLKETGASETSGKTSWTLALDEWAEELAAVGKRRNLIERKLRELSLNFLRYDAMLNNKLPEVFLRVTSVLPSKTREQMSHLAAEQVLAKFNWTDIVKLVAKEWSLFERIFGDKELFLRNCDIINDRFDAHAKSADAADLALYRRALAYVEDRLAKMG